MKYAIIGSGVAGIAAIEAIRSVDGLGHIRLGTLSITLQKCKEFKYQIPIQILRVRVIHVLS